VIEERLPAGVELVRAPNAGPMTLTGTNTYLVGGVADEGVWVIDPGPADAGHVERVIRAAEARGGVAGIALTHRHLDHAESVGPLLERYPVEVVAGRRLAEKPAPFSEPEAEGLRVTRELGDGDMAGPLLALATPGHSADHVSFLWADILFCGDTVLGEGSVFIPPGGGSLERYLDSLRRLLDLGLEALCPGHGPVVWEPRAKLTEYLDHRLDRERRLVTALDRGLRRQDDLLDAAWDDAPRELRFAAALTLEAHLDKLEREGRLPAGVERLAL
jgi:glyoxylase-like metal-dependent hydrolase (beta-lactamase superfamily II)